MTKNCFVVGATSSLGEFLKRYFTSNNFDVFGTHRNIKNNNSKIDFYLDYEDEESLEEFSKKIPNLDCLIFVQEFF